MTHSMKINDIELTEETIQLAREQFCKNCVACIQEAEKGEVRVNDLPRYIQWQNEMIQESRQGKYDHTLAFLQRALYIQTGKMLAILP